MQVGLNMHLYVDIGDASTSLWGSTSSLILLNSCDKWALYFTLVFKFFLSDIELSPNRLSRALELSSCVPLVRSLRALHYWPESSPAGPLLSARHHAATILHGEGGQLPPRSRNKKGGAGPSAGNMKGSPFPTLDRVSPYQTFVDMIAAKGEVDRVLITFKTNCSEPKIIKTSFVMIVSVATLFFRVTGSNLHFMYHAGLLLAFSVHFI